MKEVTNFMYYMCNKWSPEEAKHVFGESLGAHIFSKWMRYTETLRWFGDLDDKCKQKLVDRANEIYGG